MERVVGIGGTFFRAREPEKLRAWYAEHLGFDVQDWGGQPFVAKGSDVTVWSIFAGESDYWPAEQQWMLNYRVEDLDAMLAQLRAAGVAVDDKTSEDENGRFGWATDPEGNRFELWQPPLEASWNRWGSGREAAAFRGQAVADPRERIRDLRLYQLVGREGHDGPQARAVRVQRE